MGELRITIQTDQGSVTVTWDQAMVLGRVLKDYEAAGVEPVWHLNHCGCCVSVHPAGDGSNGWLIGGDGGKSQIVDGRW